MPGEISPATVRTASELRRNGSDETGPASESGEQAGSSVQESASAKNSFQPRISDNGENIDQMDYGKPLSTSGTHPRRFVPASFRFSPAITGGALLLSIAMLFASHWQWNRYKYKVRLLESFRQNSLSTPLTFPPVAKSDRTLTDSENLREKKVRLSGVFDYSHQLIVTNREGQMGSGVGPGHLLFTPFLLNGGAGPAIFVNRGFIPFADREPNSWAKYSFYPGETVIDAVVQAPVLGSALGPGNPGGKSGGQQDFRRIWFFEEIPAMAKEYAIPTLENVYLQLLGGPPTGEFPREAVRIQVPPTTHFGYTIEWILLAFTTLALAFFFQCVRFRRNRPPQSALGLMQENGSRAIVALILSLGLLSPSRAVAVEAPGALPDEVGIIQHLGAQLDMSLPFRGPDGAEHPLSSFVPAGRPFIIVPVYYGCPRLCTLTFSGLTESLNAAKLKLGKDFSVIAFSIDPDEGPELAAKKSQELYAKLTSVSPEVAAQGFPLLTGRQESIAALTKQLGFIYRRDGMDFAHTPGIMVVTPGGKVSRYFLGVDYPESDVRYALVEASNGQIGGLAEQIFLYCFRFDPTKGKYTPAAWRLMRGASGLCAVCLFGFLCKLWRREFALRKQAMVAK